MARKTQRAELRLTDEQREKLEHISKSRTKPFREIQRAQILLRYSGGMPISQIQDQLRVSRPTI